ncbi:MULTISPECIES: rhodanese-like domain-containing protein [Shewanella]|uniref:Rhodanese-like domain-containing protein n=1 Tax=Shewanella holmiensis TaxID=2952222 RepID=A0A9X2WPF5_9GAMM|nr:MULTISPECIES: rhodanese-like domain-containing protein [Shewanella]MCT7943176.1 rhodanese-like domain-containing protein [Shewanella holmiensis]MDP5145959.1 rhodanese-like domain-containing protein [Shewanella sp. ULN5]
MKSSKRVSKHVSFLSILAAGLMLFNQVSVAKDVSTQEAWDIIKTGTTIIDVRTAEEFAAGHIEGAINIPFDQIVAGVEKFGLKNDASIVLYCRSGRRSRLADESLLQAGFTDSVNAGGYESLAASKP